MSKAVEFTKELDKLFHQRTHWLRSVLGKRKPGAPPIFNRKKVDAAIKRLQTIALDALASKTAKEEFTKFVLAKRSWHVRGHGHVQKRKLFDEWFNRTADNQQKLIYAFWKGRRCIYIGRTGGGGSRPRSHFEKLWFKGITRIDVFSIRQRTQLAKLECLAIHCFLPIQNKIKAPAAKWAKRCPICKIHKDISSELRKIFRLK